MTILIEINGLGIVSNGRAYDLPIEKKGMTKRGGKIKKKGEKHKKKGGNPKIKKGLRFHEFKTHDSFSYGLSKKIRYENKFEF